MKFQTVVPVVIGALFLLVMPELAFAADPGVATANRFITWLTGPLARSLAVLAIIGCAYGGLKGRLERDHALGVIAAIVIIFSAATFADMAQSG